MRIMKKILLAGMALAVMGGAVQAASTVVTETRLTPNPKPNANIVDFRIFDTNGDGVLSAQEVGEKLFYTFDKDGNQLIDNIEFERPMVLTFAPMTRETIQYIDYNGDGRADKTTVSQEAFMQRTGLSQFSMDPAGLSAAGFIHQPMKQVDRDLSGQIDIREWKEAYFAELRPLPQNDSFRYND